MLNYKEKQGAKFMSYPILDYFDDDGVINKDTVFDNEIGVKNLYERFQREHIDTALFVFIRENFEEFLDFSKLELVYQFKNASNINNLYLYDNKFIVALSSLGGPAATGLMEKLGFMGINTFFACGDAGQIDKDFDTSKLALIEKAIRDEGTSYHYLEPSVFAETDKELTDFIAHYLESKNLDYERIITWTTDAFYRETRKALEKRIDQGAVCVEMECAGWCACAKKRGYKFAQLLYFSDVVRKDGHKWHGTRDILRKWMIDIMVDCVDSYATMKIEERNKENN